jgi:hypothetical protein
MQSTIHPSFDQAGQPSAASIAPHKANGSAKIECSHLIISIVAAVLFHQVAMQRLYFAAGTPLPQQQNTTRL